MLKDLVKIATRLDSLGLTKEADVIDGIIRKIAERSRTMAPSIESHVLISAMMDNPKYDVKKFEDWLQGSGKVYVTQASGDFLFKLWREDPLEMESSADPRREDTYSVDPRLVESVVSDAKGLSISARLAHNICEKIKTEGYGDWQYTER